MSFLTHPIFESVGEPGEGGGWVRLAGVLFGLNCLPMGNILPLFMNVEQSQNGCKIKHQNEKLSQIIPIDLGWLGGMGWVSHLPVDLGWVGRMGSHLPVADVQHHRLRVPALPSPDILGVCVCGGGVFETS